MDPLSSGELGAKPSNIVRFAPDIRSPYSLQGSGVATPDLRWTREFRLNRKKKEEFPVITLGLDAFNVLNRVNYVGFVGNPFC